MVFSAISKINQGFLRIGRVCYTLESILVAPRSLNDYHARLGEFKLSLSCLNITKKVTGRYNIPDVAFKTGWVLRLVGRFDEPLSAMITKQEPGNSETLPVSRR